MDIDLTAYFDRIGFAGSACPDLDTLCAIHRLHPAAIPFENLGPWLGQAVPLDLPELERKLVRQRRGGFCCEHNLLLAAVLRGLGYELATLAARVVWNMPDGTVRPRTHMLLRVQVEGHSWIADVGFGGLTLTAPLRLQTEEEQSTPHGPFRIVRDGAQRVMQARVGGEWKPLYRFDLQPHLLADYEMASWYLCHHPESMFRQRLVAARALPHGRFALWDNELAWHGVDGVTQRRRLASADELASSLERDFGIALPDAPTLHERLGTLATR